MAERSRQELIQACLRPPIDEALLLKHKLALSQLTLEHAGGRLHLAKLQIVYELGKELI